MKTLSTILTALFLAWASAALQQEIQVTVNGDDVQFPDVQPMLVKGRVMVPLRGVFEKMEIVVDWNQKTRTVTASRPGSDVEFTFGEPAATVNGKKVPLDQPALIIQDRAMVPLRFLSETVGAKVQWQVDTHTVAITTDGS